MASRQIGRHGVGPDDVNIVLEYDQSLSVLPSGFVTAITYAANYLDSLILNPITVTIDVGYGEVAGETADGFLGAAIPNTTDLSYSTVKNALATAATTSAAETAVANLPATAGNISVAYAQEQAWGLMSATGTQLDGYVGFGEDNQDGIVYDYDTSGTVPSGEYSFVGVAEHELTHVLGRVSNIGEGGGDTVLDLFQYSSAGHIATVSRVEMQSSYFSINGGTTDLGAFDDTSDPGDWAQTSPYTADSFNAYADPGVVNPVTAIDEEEMNVIGFEVACFATGTRIATARGEVPVEALRAGEDVALTAEGRAAPVVWVGWRRVAPSRHPNPLDLMPVRVRRDAVAPGLPARDLVLSPDHALALDGVLIPVRYLLNGRTIAREAAERVTYWHVELDRHDVLLAEGLPAESYLDTGNRAAFANGGTLVWRTPEFARCVWEAAGGAPLVVSGPRLLRARRRLFRRAEQLGFGTTSRPALRLFADGRPLGATRDGERWSFALPAGARRLRLRSRAFVPNEAEWHATDCRRLGVAVGRLWLDGREAALDSPALAAGWHAPEPGFRWTDGDAALDVADARHLSFTLAMTGRYPSEPMRAGALAAAI